MRLEQKSKELKQLLSGYDTEWFLGNLTGLMGAVTRSKECIVKNDEE
jgi:hypothetical protein